MKRAALNILPLIMVFLLSSGFAPALSGDDALVLIDGKKIEAEQTLQFDRDDTVFLEATGIKPNSVVRFKVKKAGIKFADHEFEVDKTGEVKGVLHIPEERLTVTCLVEYYSSGGTFHEVKFKFKTV